MKVMQLAMKLLLSAALALLLAFPALADGHNGTSDDPEAVLERLMDILPGAFDSGAQLKAEQISGAPEADQHVRVYRSFTQIDSPDIGENVFVVTLRQGADGAAAAIDFVEFQVWTLEVDAERNAVKMWPRRFKEPQAWADVTRDSEALSELQTSDLVPSDGAAACAIYWRPIDNLLKGSVLDECLGPIRVGGERQMLTWDWLYLLDDDTLWMSFAGRDDTGTIRFGRQDQLPWRMDKVERD